MKRLITAAALGLILSVSSCSTCYECTEEVIYYDAQGNPIGTNDNTEEFCTANPDEVKDREAEGAKCQVQ